MSRLISRKIGKFQNPFGALVGIPMSDFDRSRTQEFIVAKQKQNKEGNKAREEYESDIRKRDLADAFQIAKNAAFMSTIPILNEPVDFELFKLPSAQFFAPLDFINPFHVTPTRSSLLVKKLLDKDKQNKKKAQK